MDDPDATAVIRRVRRGDPPARALAEHAPADPDAETSLAADAAVGLASLSFITATIRRRFRFWCAGAVIGLALGAGLYVVHPPAHQATAEALLTLGPNEDLLTSVDTDVTLAESRPVAAAARHQLGLTESVSKLLTSYSAAAVTNRVLQITANGPSPTEAARRASALTTAFLDFRADQLKAYQRLVTGSLDQQIAQSRAQLATITRQVNELSSNAGTPAETARLKSLQDQQTAANTALNSLLQSAQGTEQGTRVATTAAVTGSKMINAGTPIVKSRLKSAGLYAGGGLIGGLVVSVGFVVISALISDRLRWRDDIAAALGTSVRLSVGRVRRRPLARGGRRLFSLRDPAIERIAGHLRAALPENLDDAALAVIPADRIDAAARAIVALALSCARDGKRVIVADLCAGAPAARLLGAKGPGVRPVTVPAEGGSTTRLVVVIPERGDRLPIGPLTAAAATAPPAPASKDLADAHSSADVLLTLVALDPMYGADHLATWSSEVVVLVTTGESSWTRLQSIGELARLGGARLRSAVLVGADKTDESLGVARPAAAARDVESVTGDYHAAPRELFAAVNGAPNGKPPENQ